MQLDNYVDRPICPSAFYRATRNMHIADLGRADYAVARCLSVRLFVRNPYVCLSHAGKGGGALCAGNAVALLVFGPVMP